MKQALIDNNPVLKQSFNFAIQVMHFSEVLAQQKQFNLSNQIFRSGTSIGTNSMETQNAESKADFIHKLKIAAKEAEETPYCWLLLCDQTKIYTHTQNLPNQLNEIQKILNSILKTAKRKTPLSYFFSIFF
jgi:four helix bundle protein